MTTYYNTTRGVVDDPLPIELWSFSGTRAFARVNRPGDVRLTWADNAAGTSEYDMPLNSLTAGLLACDGTVLIVATLNGIRHVSTPFVAKPYNDGETDEVRLKVTGGTPYTLFGGELIWRAPGQPLQVQGSYSAMSLEGSLESVVKNIIAPAANAVQHPILVKDVRGTTGDGPKVKVAYGDFETVADALDDLLPGTGFRVSTDVWVPGDPPPTGFATVPALRQPTVLVDVVPYRAVDGLVFSHVGGDLASWEMEVTRRSASATVVQHVDANKVETFGMAAVGSDQTVTPWHARHTFVKTKDENDTMQAAGVRELVARAKAVSVDATVSPGVAWEYGNDGRHPRQYQIGDIATLDLGPYIGTVRQTVVEVTAELTGEGLKVVPKVGTPDTMKNDLYSTVAEIDRRLSRQERRN